MAKKTNYQDEVDKKKSKFEEVSVSFHYLDRYDIKNDREIPITTEEFKDITNGFKSLSMVKEIDKDYELLIKSKSRVKVLKCEDVIVDLSICGLYEAGYWGHEYRNLSVGKITADSLNLRPFFFLLYLSKSGKIYIASQYLGNYGGYSPLKETIYSLMKNKKHLEFHSFNNTSFFVKNAKPKAVEIKFSKKSNDIASKNEYGISGAWSFSKESEEDNFEDNIKRDFFPLLGQGKRQIKDGIKEIIENKKLFDMKDRDIEECKVLLDTLHESVSITYTDSIVDTV